MFLKSILFTAITLTAFLTSAQKPESVLFSTGDSKVTVGDFQYIYEKNNKNDDNYYTAESVKEYLRLYVNFKLKVKEARNQGIDTTEKFLTEFKTYRDQLTKPYMTDQETTDRLVLEAYDRMKEELKASHILIRLAEDASASEIDTAYAKIKKIYRKAKKGNDFASLAESYSEDPSVKNNKGELGYFTVFHLIYPFENQAYNTKAGKVSKPFRTEFGYHILKLSDRRPYQGDISVSQLFIPFEKDATEEQKNRTKQTITELYQKISDGESFEKMVGLYSQDNRTKGSNGKLPEFNSFSFNIAPKVKEVAFTLQNDGDISEPFESQAGWHILKRNSLKPLKSFEEMEKIIRTKVRKDARGQLSFEKLLSNIKKQYRFKEMEGSKNIFYSQVDSSLLSGNWQIANPSIFNQNMFLIGKKYYSQLDFAKYLEEKQKNQRYKTIPFAIDKFYNSFVNNSLIMYSDEHLEENYPEFRNLVNEYREGMMLFEITDQKVWSKAMKDTLGQLEFYNSHIDKYMWKKRVEAETYICRDENIAKQVVAMIEKDGKTADEIATELNMVNPLNISYSHGKYEEGENDLLTAYFGKKGVFKFFDDESESWRVANMKTYYEASPKKIKEIRGIVIADYQQYLESNWIEELKKKYPVAINEKILAELINNHTR
ncbi:MAG: peptidylprolyl isomerase [Bacteroidetes bacterium]|nr:peptidylprolyl isomerase [Bacteroidota bacterium]